MKRNVCLLMLAVFSSMMVLGWVQPTEAVHGAWQLTTITENYTIFDYFGDGVCEVSTEVHLNSDVWWDPDADRVLEHRYEQFIVVDNWYHNGELYSSDTYYGPINFIGVF